VKTFNKRGDGGETSLLYGVRVKKSDPHCEAYGTIDEAASSLALAYHSCSPQTREIILKVQQDLKLVMAELAVPIEHYPKFRSQEQEFTPQMTLHLEKIIEELEEQIEMPQAFVLPGGCPSAAALDLARAITRRAEREVVKLKEKNLLANEEVLKYLNRLSDLIYTLARYEEKESLKK